MPDHDHLTPVNAFDPDYLRRLDQHDEPVTAGEAVTGGFWRVVRSATSATASIACGSARRTATGLSPLSPTATRPCSPPLSCRWWTGRGASPSTRTTTPVPFSTVTAEPWAGCATAIRS